ncbi:hypothetical protein L3V86_04360 [Thiotrichales bacterium 19S11-10]|nr:hypothetical protein [Thiotrichales bacterium 19S11-10]
MSFIYRVNGYYSQEFSYIDTDKPIHCDFLNNCWLLSASIAASTSPTEAIKHYEHLLNQKGYDVKKLEKEGIHPDLLENIYDEMGLSKLKVKISSLEDIETIVSQANTPIIMVRPTVADNIHAEAIIGVVEGQPIVYDTMTSTYTIRERPDIDIWIQNENFHFYSPSKALTKFSKETIAAGTYKISEHPVTHAFEINLLEKQPNLPFENQESNNNSKYYCNIL